MLVIQYFDILAYSLVKLQILTTYILVYFFVDAINWKVYYVLTSEVVVAMTVI